MKRLTSIKSIAAAAIVLGAFGAASAAHARTDVFLSVGIPATIGYVQPAPVYVQPQAVYVRPRPVYTQPQVQYSRGWDRRGPYGDRDGDGVVNAYDRDNQRHHGRYAQLYGPRGDLDRDGVPNRYDRFPDNSHRR